MPCMDSIGIPIYLPPQYCTLRTMATLAVYVMVSSVDR